MTRSNLALLLLLAAAALLEARSGVLTPAHAASASASFQQFLSKEVTSLTDGTVGTSLIGAATPAPAPAPVAKGGALQLFFLFVAWYAFNASYNVYNAFMKKDFQLPYAVAAWQLLVGPVCYSIPLWLLRLRKIPNISKDDFMRLLPIALLNTGGHAMTVAATFEVGGGSFTHVIKAAEPVVSALLGLVVNRIVPKPLTALSLLPVTYGVAYASTLGKLNPKTMSKELTTKAAKLAMASNFAFSMRSIMRKNLPADFQGRTHLDPANEHAVTTIISLCLLLPVVFAQHGVPRMMEVLGGINNRPAFYLNSLICGLSFYLYNEMQNKVLSSLGPVPTAVGNTLKRVVIFVALYFFTQGETFPLPKVVGCAIAIAGCLSFAVCDSKKI